MEQQNYTSKIVEHVFNTSFSDIDQSSLLRAKERLIDSLGVMMIGHHVDDVDKVVELYSAMGGAPESSVVTYKRKLPTQNAAFLNSVIMRSYDFEAIDAEAVLSDNKTTPAHISGSTVPCALAVAEIVKCSGKDFLRALILGDNLTARVLNASGFSVHDYFDGNGTANVLGATTGAALLYGLSPEELHAAYSLAINLMSGTMQNVFEKRIAFKLPIAFSAGNGILAAKLAQCAYRPGVIDPIGGPRGYFQLFHSAPEPEKLLFELDNKLIADVVIKPWPACRATHGSINATLDALAGRTLKPEEVSQVKIHVAQGTKSFVGVGFEFGMTKQYEGAFSIDFLVASAILYGHVGPESYKYERMTSEELKAMLSKIEVLGDLEDSYGVNGALAEIELADGSTLSHLTEIAKGDFYRTRLSREGLLDKYYSNVRFGEVISRETADRIVEMIDDLENLDDLSSLIALIQ